MADANQPDNTRPRSGDDREPMVPEVPYETEPMEVEEPEPPRRAASARLVVDSSVGSEAALREAMDPANQSLADALRLSFKVLQVVILVLVGLFLVSSCKTIGEDQSGVFTRWGRIAPLPLGNEEVLTPGLKWGVMPYPAGEFVLFKESNRIVDVGNAFSPNSHGRSQQEMLDRADPNNPLNPGRDGDGSLISSEGDLLHMKVSARYSIDKPRNFVENVNDNEPAKPGEVVANANLIVRLALQQAAVQVATTHNRAELTGRPDEPKALIKDRAQQILDRIACGIRLDSVDVNDNTGPLAIEKAAGDLTEAEQDVRTNIQSAVKTANDTLIGVAGEDYRELIKLIDRYEEAVVNNDDDRATEVLSSINARLEDPKTTGKVSSILGVAKAYRDQIEGSLGAEARRFESLLSAFHDNPQLVIRQKWMEAFAEVVKKPDAEVIYVPAGILAMQLNLSGNAQVQDLRRKKFIDRVGQESDLKNTNPDMPYIFRGEDINKGPGRQLKQDVRGRVMPTGSGEKN